jgi:hypothetical protein
VGTLGMRGVPKQSGLVGAHVNDESIIAAASDGDQDIRVGANQHQVGGVVQPKRPS